MAKTNASTLRKVAEREARKPRPLSPAEIRANLVKKWASITALIVVGGLIGATVGISQERDRNMETYSTQSYEAGLTDAKKSWYASVVKANEKNKINLSNISLPIDGVVERFEGSLYCKSLIMEGNDFTFGYQEEFKCGYVVGRAQEFNVGELEKVIPEGGSIKKSSETKYVCTTGEFTRIGGSLEECVYVLRNKTNADYNEFIKDNYIEKDAAQLLISTSPDFPESEKEGSFGGNTLSSGSVSSSGGFLSGSSSGSSDIGEIPKPGSATIPPAVNGGGGAGMSIPDEEVFGK